MNIPKVFVNQISNPKHWVGKTKVPHMAQMGYSAPEVSKVIQRLIELDTEANNFVSYVNSLPVKMLKGEGTYYWQVQGISERNYPLVKATIDAAGNTEITDNHRAGYKGGVFYLWFGENCFRGPESITSNHPEIFVLRITGDGVPVGTMTRYEVQLQGTSVSELFVPASEVAPGSRWYPRFGLVEHTESVRGTEVRHASHFTLENSTSVLRKNYEVPGNMIDMGKNNPLEFNLVSDDGKQFSAWLPKLEYDFFKQFEQDKANLMLYGKATTIGGAHSMIKGETGDTVEAGLGLYEFMNTGNIFNYNVFDVDVFGKFVLDITYNMVGNSRNDILVSTGKYGLFQAHEALSRKAAGYNWASSNHNFQVNKSDGTVTLNEGQFIELIWVNGLRIKFIHDQMLDNPIASPMMHPNGGPVTSYIYNIYDFGTTNGEPNIQRLKTEAYEELYGYVNGMRDPFNPYNNLAIPRQMASSKDGYAVYKQWIGGLHMNNPKKTGRFIPTIYNV